MRGKKSEERRIEQDTLADLDSGLNKFELLRVESVSLVPKIAKINIEIM